MRQYSTATRLFAAWVLLCCSMLAVPVTASATTAVVPGSVNAILSNTYGSSVFSYHANANGWYRGTINVSYVMYWGDSSSGPWSHYDDDSKTCTQATSCSTVTKTQSCNEGWYKLVASANGAGGAAENNPDTDIAHIHKTIIVKASADPAVASSCKYPSRPI